MKKTIGTRLNEIMTIRGLSQADIVAMCQPYCIQRGLNLNRQDFSRYVLDKVKPSQDKIDMLCAVLGVSECWLLGFEITDGLTQEEVDLLSAYRLATPKDKQIIQFILSL